MVLGVDALRVANRVHAQLRAFVAADTGVALAATNKKRKKNTSKTGTNIKDIKNTSKTSKTGTNMKNINKIKTSNTQVAQAQPKNNHS